MKTKILTLLLLGSVSIIYAQEFVKGTLITTRYDTIANVDIQVMNDAKSLLRLTYIDHDGNKQRPDIDDIKCYTRGDEVFCRIYSSGEMILVKQLVQGKKLNLFERTYNGATIYYIEKVYDECIKVPSAAGKFSKVLSNFLKSSPELAERIKSKDLQDIHEIVKLYNES